MRFLLTALVVAGGLVSAAASAQQQGGGGDFMSRIDTDHDGKISLAEYTAFAEQRWTRVANGADKVAVAGLDDRAKRAFANITPDAQGNVTHAAYIAAQGASFKKADTNGDGSLDAAELGAMFPRPPGGGRGPGGQGAGQGGGGQ